MNPEFAATCELDQKQFNIDLEPVQRDDDDEDGDDSDIALARRKTADIKSKATHHEGTSEDGAASRTDRSEKEKGLIEELKVDGDGTGVDNGAAATAELPKSYPRLLI